jgi:hypothetical protein
MLRNNVLRTPVFSGHRIQTFRRKAVTLSSRVSKISKAMTIEDEGTTFHRRVEIMLFHTQCRITVEGSPKHFIPPKSNESWNDKPRSITFCAVSFVVALTPSKFRYICFEDMITRNSVKHNHIFSLNQHVHILL